MKKYTGKTIVVKYGGNAMVNEELKDAVMEDIILLNMLGIKTVLVHGGGPEINHLLHRLGLEPRFVGGLRYTDAETMEVVQMVLAGKLNKDLVARLCARHGKAIGLCGVDAGMLRCRRHTEEELGYVGDIVSVNTFPVEQALSSGMIPVIATIGADEDGETYNINADTAAAAIAIALGACKLVSLTDIPGLLMDKDDESTLIHEVKISQVPKLVAQGIISGGMLPKISCCVDSIAKGVREAVIIDGRKTHAILLEMFSDQGNGTLFY
ncbi:MAG: acetylglutamate kinase [Oscillospiraceae bacterium]|nr:acetylglutamate kinase [Oscillospiraceae bacterium]